MAKERPSIFFISVLIFAILGFSAIAFLAWPEKGQAQFVYNCSHAGVSIPETRKSDEKACIEKSKQAYENWQGESATVGVCYTKCNAMVRKDGVFTDTCTDDPESQFNRDEFWGQSNIDFCNCINACPDRPENPVLVVMGECCNKLLEPIEYDEVLNDNADEELKKLYQDMADEQEIKVPECSEEYPQLCLLPLDVTEKIIDWFYEDMMQRLKANFKHTWTVKDAGGTSHINWGIGFGWLQRLYVNFEKNLRYGDTRPDAKYCEVAGIGTCGDVGAYVDQEFPKAFPNVKMTYVSMAWETLNVDFDHTANIVLPINPKTKKQYELNEIPQALFDANSADELPVQWQNAMVLDAWGRNVSTLASWYNEYKHNNGEFALGKH